MSYNREEHAAYMREYNKRPEVKEKIRARQRKKYRPKQDFIKSLHTPCIACGAFELCFMDFHHVDESTKKYNVSIMNWNSKETIIAEAAKCVSLCANCHRKVHAKLLTLLPVSNDA